jgi:hypothetical protein
MFLLGKFDYSTNVLGMKFNQDIQKDDILIKVKQLLVKYEAPSLSISV